MQEKRIGMVLKSDPTVAEYGYIFIGKDGVSVYNGRVGILFGRKFGGRDSKLCQLADKHGEFVVTDGRQFMKVQSSVEQVSDIIVKKEEQVLVVVYRKGQGRIEIPISFDVAEITHKKIKWQNQDDKTNSIPISSKWTEIAELISNEGELVWGDVLGVYYHNSRIQSLDLNMYLVSEKEEVIPGISEFFIPRVLLQLGLNDMNFAKTDDDNNVYLVGKDVQYVCSVVSQSNYLQDLSKLKDEAATSVTKSVTLDLTKTVWRRASLFADSEIEFGAHNGKLKVTSGNWSEFIGSTDADDFKVRAKASLLKRWAIAGRSHSFSVNDGIIYLTTTTRAGLNFYGAIGKDDGLSSDASGEHTAPVGSIDSTAGDDEAVEGGTNLFGFGGGD